MKKSTLPVLYLLYAFILITLNYRSLIAMEEHSAASFNVDDFYEYNHQSDNTSPELLQNPLKKRKTITSSTNAGNDINDLTYQPSTPYFNELSVSLEEIVPFNMDESGNVYSPTTPHFSPTTPKNIEKPSSPESSPTLIQIRTHKKKKVIILLPEGTAISSMDNNKNYFELEATIKKSNRKKETLLVKKDQNY